MTETPDSLEKIRSNLLFAILHSDIGEIVRTFSTAIIYKNLKTQKTIKGIQNIEKHLISLFEDKKLVIALSENRITLKENKALEWSNFTLFIDQVSKDNSLSYDGNYSIIWEKNDSENWTIGKITDSSFKKFPL